MPQHRASVDCRMPAYYLFRLVCCYDCLSVSWEPLMRRPPGSGEINCHCDDSLGQTNSRCLIFNIWAGHTYMHTRTCIYFPCNEEIRCPVNQDRALLLVKLNYLQCRYRKNKATLKGQCSSMHLWIDQSGFRSDRGLPAARTWPQNDELRWSL